MTGDAQVVVHLDEAALARLDADRVEAEVGRVGAATDSDEQLVARQRRPVVQCHGHGAVGAVTIDPLGAGAEVHDDALVTQCCHEVLARGGLLVPEQPIGGLDDLDVRAQTPHRLCHLAPDDAASEHEQPLRDLLGGRDVTAVPRRRLCEPVDGGHGSHRARGDHHADGGLEVDRGAVVLGDPHLRSRP